MTSQEMNTKIQNVAKIVVSEMNKGGYNCVDMFNCIICGATSVENIDFENEVSYYRFQKFVAREVRILDEKLYRTIYPIYIYKQG